MYFTEGCWALKTIRPSFSCLEAVISAAGIFLKSAFAFMDWLNSCKQIRSELKLSVSEKKQQPHVNFYVPTYSYSTLYLFTSSQDKLMLLCIATLRHIYRKTVPHLTDSERRSLSLKITITFKGKCVTDWSHYYSWYIKDYKRRWITYTAKK